jgi:hypothetical protein
MRRILRPRHLDGASCRIAQLSHGSGAVPWSWTAQEVPDDGYDDDDDDADEDEDEDEDDGEDEDETWWVGTPECANSASSLDFPRRTSYTLAVFRPVEPDDRRLGADRRTVGVCGCSDQATCQRRQGRLSEPATRPVHELEAS